MSWKLEEHAAHWHAEPVTLQVDLAHRRCSALGPFGRLDLWALVCRDHGANAAARLVESFCRGGDLVARYERGASGEHRCDLHWRVVPSLLDNVLLCLEWLVSWQTLKLDDRVDCHARTSTPTASRLWLCNETWRAVESPAVSASGVIRGVAAAWEDRGGYVELVWPGDFDGVQIERQGDRTAIDWRIVEPHLEKGVIRRVRFRSYLLPAMLTEDRIEACRREFAASSIPLTA